MRGPGCQGGGQPDRARDHEGLDGTLGRPRGVGVVGLQAPVREQAQGVRGHERAVRVGLHGPVHGGPAGAQGRGGVVVLPRPVAQELPPGPHIRGEHRAAAPAGAVEHHPPGRGRGVAEPRDDDGAGCAGGALGGGEVGGLPGRPPHGRLGADAHAGDEPGQVGGGRGVPRGDHRARPVRALEDVVQQMPGGQVRVHALRLEGVDDPVQGAAGLPAEAVAPGHVGAQPLLHAGPRGRPERRPAQSCSDCHVGTRRRRAPPEGSLRRPLGRASPAVSAPARAAA